MKKSLALTLALVFVLGIAGTAFAANPFVDVPANHWAYGAVKTLAHDGLVDGMSDGTFQGDKEMTRYEMAQIVAKAMARTDKANAADKALIEKLQAEFATELDNLGVRVSNLEKKVGNIKFFGDVRLRYTEKENASNQPSFSERFRLNAVAQVNDRTTLNARWNVMNNNEFGTDGKSVSNSTSWDNNQITVANMVTKGVLHNTDLMIGRYDLNLGQTAYLAGTVGMVDGVQANIKDGKVKAMLGYASMKNIFDAQGDSNIFKKVAAAKSIDGTDRYGVDNVYYAQVDYAFDPNFKMDVNYLKNQDRGDNNKLLDVIGAGVNVRVAPNLRLIGDYWKNKADDTTDLVNNGDDADAYVVRLAWKGVNPAVVHSFGFAVEYLKVDDGAGDAWATGAQLGWLNNTKAWDVQANYTLAKNVTLDAIYQFNVKNADGDDIYDSTTNKKTDKYTRIQLNYLF